MGGEAPYIERGNISRVWLVRVPVRDLERSIGFYVDTLGLELLVDAREKNWVEVGGKEPQAKILLYVPGKGDRAKPGGDTGVLLETDSIFELHRKLVDEEVPFLVKPERHEMGGIVAIFLDPDGNRLTAVEDPGHYQRFQPPDRPRKGRPREGEGSCCRRGSER
jgi:catechol 2,3-dioxygenase-like lactoylglutathione lyase family enzyme